MNLIKTKIEGLLILKPTIFKDKEVFYGILSSKKYK